MSNPSLRSLGMALCVLASVLFTATFADATQCNVHGGGCQGTVTITVYNPSPGEPVPLCQKNAPLYQVTVNLTCFPFTSVNESEVVCSAAGLPVVVEVDGDTHTFAPSSGRTWADVFNDCDALTHTVD
jgi:hypothetical protein